MSWFGPEPDQRSVTDPAVSGDPAVSDGEPEISGGLSGGFSLRVLVYFVAQVLTAILGLFNGFLLARLIGPEGRGEFYLLTFYAITLMVLGQVGLPQAFTYFAARRQFDGLISRSVAIAIVIGGTLFVATVVLLPELEQTFLRGLEPLAIVVASGSLVFILNANFTTGIVVGRASAFGLALIYVAVNALTTVLTVVLVGMLGLGVWGALIGFVISYVAYAAAFLGLAIRKTREVPSVGAVGTRRLLGYGIQFFPATLSQFFAARADVFLLAALLVDAAAPIGYYSLAVGIAELVFLFPNAVSTFFFPHVAGGERAESDRQSAAVSRVTLLLTAAFAVALGPAAAIAILIIIPTFTPALPALFILLAATASMAPTRVLGGYLAGLRRPGLASTVNLTALVANVALNIVLIPQFGFIGSALAVLVSSVLSSVVCSAIAARLSDQPLRSFWLPRVDDLRFVFDRARETLAGIFRRRQAPG
jgi:O-antigen/teichoic acid export membrane protein